MFSIPCPNGDGFSGFYTLSGFGLCKGTSWECYDCLAISIACCSSAGPKLTFYSAGGSSADAVQAL